MWYKTEFRKKHPEPVKVPILKNGKPVLDKKGKPKMRTDFTDGHIHKRALHRTGTKFVEWLFKNWTRLEKQEKESPNN